MSITTEAIARFDEQIIDTFFNCIMKISDNLNKRYDPDSPESNALFRLFCTASRMLNQTVNKYLKAAEKEMAMQKEIQKTQNAVNINQTSFNDISTCKTNSSSTPTKKKNNRGGKLWRLCNKK